MKTTPEYSEGQRAYRDGKKPIDNPYNKIMGGGVANLTPEQWERNRKAGEWHKGWMSAYAEWAEGRTDERT